MKDDTDLFKLYQDKPGFTRWLADTIFNNDLSAAGAIAPTPRVSIAGLEAMGTNSRRAQSGGGRSAAMCRINSDRYGRLARCYAGDPGLNGWLVRNGHAIAYWRFS